MKASLIFTLSCLAFIASLGDVRVINVTNNIVGYNTTNKSFSMTSGDSLRVNIKAVRGASNVNFSVAGGHSFRGDLFSFKDQTRYRYMTAGEDLSPTINQSSGEVRIVFGVVDDPGEYGIEVWAVPSSNQSQQFPVALHYLTVTSAPSSGVTLSGDVTINYPTGGTVSNIVASNSNHWDASTGTYHYNTNDTAGSGITITTNGTGNVVTNLTTDGSGVTMELGTAIGGSGGDVYLASNNVFGSLTVQTFGMTNWFGATQIITPTNGSQFLVASYVDTTHNYSESSLSAFNSGVLLSSGSNVFIAASWNDGTTYGARIQGGENIFVIGSGRYNPVTIQGTSRNSGIMASRLSELDSAVRSMTFAGYDLDMTGARNSVNSAGEYSYNNGDNAAVFASFDADNDGDHSFLVGSEINNLYDGVFFWKADDGTTTEASSTANRQTIFYQDYFLINTNSGTHAFTVGGDMEVVNGKIYAGTNYLDLINWERNGVAL